MPGFSLLDHVFKLTNSGGRDYRVLSGDGFELDPGADVDHIPGFGQLPFGIVRKSAKPTFSFKNTTADEIRVACRHVGEIGGPSFGISIVVFRPGSILWHVTIHNCALGKGAGWKAGDKGAMDDFGGAATDIRYSFDGSPMLSIFAKPNGR